MVPDELSRIPVEHRLALVDRLSEHVLATASDAPDHGDNGRVLSVLAASLDTASRRGVAERFSRVATAPRSLIVSFARDTIKVAAPVLRWSPLIDAALLTEILADISDGHLLIMSKRDELPSDLASLLVGHGSHDVQLSVARNAGASLTDSSLSAMIGDAARDHQLEEALCGRDDLPDTAAASLMRRVRHRLQAEVGSAAAALDTAELRMALRTSETEAGSEATDTKGLSLDAFVTITRLARAGKLNEATLGGFIEQQNTGAMLMCLAKLLHLHPTIARRLVYANESEGLLIATRAVPLSRQTFAALVGFREKLVASDRPADELIKAYEAITVDLARRVMAFHRMRRAGGAGVRSEHSLPHEWALEPQTAA